MTVAPVSSGNFAPYTPGTGSLELEALHQVWQGLQQNVSSGNLASARAALDAYQQISQNLTSFGLPPQSVQIAPAFEALATALASGDLAAAQQALAGLQRELNGAQLPLLARAAMEIKQAVPALDYRVDLTGSESLLPNAVADPTLQALATAYGLQSVWTRRAEEARKEAVVSKEKQRIDNRIPSEDLDESGSEDEREDKHEEPNRDQPEDSFEDTCEDKQVHEREVEKSSEIVYDGEYEDEPAISVEYDELPGLPHGLKPLRLTDGTAETAP